LIPIKELWDLVGKPTQATFPPISTFDKRDKGVNVGATTTTAGDNIVFNNRDREVIVGFANGTVRSEDESEGEFRLVEEGLRGGHGSESAALV
jgi:hypothetical protein